MECNIEATIAAESEGFHVLPNKKNLFLKRIVNEKSCVRCVHFEETNWNTFEGCQFASSCWDLAALRQDVEGHIWNVESCAGLTHRSVRRLRLSVRWRGKYGKRGRIVYCGLDKDEQRVNLLMHLLLIMVSGCRCIS